MRTLAALTSLFLLMTAQPAAGALSAPNADAAARDCGGRVDADCDVPYLGGQTTHCTLYINTDPQDFDPDLNSCWDVL